jgi:hypothetical protein
MEAESNSDKYVLIYIDEKNKSKCFSIDTETLLDALIRVRELYTNEFVETHFDSLINCELIKYENTSVVIRETVR